MKIGRPLTAILLALAVIALPACSKLQAKDQLNRGIKAFKDRDFDVAEKYFLEALKLDPELDLAYEDLAMTYVQQIGPSMSDTDRDKSNKAIETFMKVYERNPKNVNAVKQIAKLYSKVAMALPKDNPDKAKSFDSAKQWFLKWVEVENQNKEPLFSIAYIDLTIVYEGVPDEGTATALSIEDRDRYMRVIDESIDYFKKTLALDQKDAESKDNLSQCYLKKSELTTDEAAKKELLRQQIALSEEARELRRLKGEK